MVTTRSADKRADAQEDLVLRSRTIHSPLATPSQPRKRGLTTLQKQDPGRKRARLGLDGTTEAEHQKQHESGMSSTGGHDQTLNPQASTVSVDGEKSFSEDYLTSTVADGAAADRKDDSSPSKGNIFRTPATSRHKRFGSEELGDGASLGSAGTNSSAQNAYDTAEEVIEDSDEAPELATAKIKPARPQQKARQTPRPKRTPMHAASEQFLPEPLHIVAEVPSVALEDEPAIGADSVDELEGVSVAAELSNLESSNAVPVDLGTEVGTAAEAETQLEPFSIPGTTDLQGHSGSQSTAAKSDSASKIVHFDSTPLPTAAQLHRDQQHAPVTKNIRPPDTARSSLSSFRHNRIREHAQRSGGGFRLERTWKTKSSAFAIA